MLLFATIVSITACGGNGANRTLYYPISDDPECLDPQIATGQSAEIAINNCFEGLVRFDDTGNIIPGVAESWTVSKDGRIYTFKLRENAKWHFIDNFSYVLEDYKTALNQNVTADDFVFAFRRALTPATKAPHATKLFPIKFASSVYSGTAEPKTLGVTAVDKHTLRIELSSPSVEFMDTLTTAICMPCNETFFNATKGRYGLDITYTMCNGPFYLSRWTEDTSLLLRRNGDYSGNSGVAPSAVYLNINTDYASVIQKLSDGSYSAATLPYYQKSALEEIDGLTIKEYQNATWSFLFNSSNEVLKNDNLRMALCYSIYRKQFSEGHNYEYANGIIPDCCVVRDENYRTAAGMASLIDYNDTQAKALWSAGLAELGKTSVSIAILCTSEFELSMRKQIQVWQRLFGVSVNITIEILDMTSINLRINRGNYQIVFSTYCALSSFGTALLQGFATGAAENSFGYSSSTYDNLSLTLSENDTLEKAVSACVKAEKFLLEHGAIYPVFKEYDLFVMPDTVSGIALYPAGENVSFINGRVK